MNSWHLIPWTLQYLISGVFIIIISTVIYKRNRGSPAYKHFFTYGFCTSMWVILAFLHRNAPTAELSNFFFRIDLLFVSIAWIFLPLTILCLWKENKAYFWLGLPALMTGIYALLSAPFDIHWTNFGWSYKFTGGFSKVFYPMGLLYLALFSVAIVALARGISSKTLALKYIIVFIILRL